ncbi:MAG TPA: UDP-N-acetylglucosamine 1-carboxyvinyltransferase [Clostridiales bacterium]|nr:UDP-N-acetylglucosamine 1-carboxyvinyltransferase [Clostridiales bacterium]
MSGFQVTGGEKLSGRLNAEGSKNAALPILAATILNGKRNTIFHCPMIRDVCMMMEILRSLGCCVQAEGGSVFVDSSGLRTCEVLSALASEMRSSVILLGPLLARCGKAVISHPGGCAKGKEWKSRPFPQIHLPMGLNPVF